MEITLRGEPFPHLLAACGGVTKELRTVRLHHDRLIVVLGNHWACHGHYHRHLVPAQRRWD